MAPFPYTAPHPLPSKANRSNLCTASLYNFLCHCLTRGLSGCLPLFFLHPGFLNFSCVCQLDQLGSGCWQLSPLPFWDYPNSPWGPDLRELSKIQQKRCTLRSAPSRAEECRASSRLVKLSSAKAGEKKKEYLGGGHKREKLGDTS